MPTPAMPRRRCKSFVIPKRKIMLIFLVNVYNESRCLAAHFLSFEELLGRYLEPIGNHPALSALALMMEHNADAVINISSFPTIKILSCLLSSTYTIRVNVRQLISCHLNDHWVHIYSQLASNSFRSGIENWTQCWRSRDHADSVNISSFPIVWIHLYL